MPLLLVSEKPLVRSMQKRRSWATGAKRMRQCTLHVDTTGVSAILFDGRAYRRAAIAPAMASASLPQSRTWSPKIK